MPLVNYNKVRKVISSRESMGYEVALCNIINILLHRLRKIEGIAKEESVSLDFDVDLKFIKSVQPKPKKLITSWVVLDHETEVNRFSSYHAAINYASVWLSDSSEVMIKKEEREVEDDG